MAVQIWIQSFNEKRVYLYANLVTTNRKKIVERESKKYTISVAPGNRNLSPGGFIFSLSLLLLLDPFL